MLLLVLVLCASFALVGCDSCNEPDDTDTDTSANADTDTNSDTNVDSGIVEPQHSHQLPASPSDDVSSDYEMQ